MWSQLSLEPRSSTRRDLSCDLIPLILSAMPLTSPSLQDTKKSANISFKCVWQNHPPLLVKLLVLQDAACDPGAVKRGVGVHWPDDDLDLRVNASLLVWVRADEGECANTLAVEAHVL